MSDTKDLEQMIAAPTILKFGGKDIELKTLKVKQLPTVLKIIRPFIHLFADKTTRIDVTTVLMDNTDSAISMVAVLTGETEEWVGELDLDEMVQLFTAVVEVNLDFFIKKVFPSVTGAMGRLNAAVSLETPQPTLGQSTSTS